MKRSLPFRRWILAAHPLPALRRRRRAARISLLLLAGGLTPLACLALLVLWDLIAVSELRQWGAGLIGLAGVAGSPDFEWPLAAGRSARVQAAAATGLALSAVLLAAAVHTWLVRPLAALRRSLDRLAAANFLKRPPGAPANWSEVIDALAGLVDEQAGARTALRESEQRYRSLTDSLDDAVVVMSGPGEVLYANPSACNLLGYQSDELACRLLSTRVQSERRAAAADAWRQAQKGRIARLDRCRLRSKSGRWLLFDVRLSPVRYGGEDAVLAVARDVTEAHSLEERLRQSQKMEALGTMAGGVAHDFNNLLTGILGSLSLALMDIRPGEPLERPLCDALKAAERAAEVTRQNALLQPPDPGPVPGPQLERLGRGDGAAAQAGDQPPDRDPDPRLPRSVGGQGRRRPGEPGADEHLPQRPRRHERRRHPHDPHRERLHRRALRPAPPAQPARRVRAGVGDRHRLRHRPGHHGENLRPLLHHQGGGQGDRSRAGGGLWHRRASQRLADRRIEARRGDQPLLLPAPHRGDHRRGERGRRERGRGRDRAGPAGRGRGGGAQPRPGDPGALRLQRHRGRERSRGARSAGRGRGQGRSGDPRSHHAAHGRPETLAEIRRRSADLPVILSSGYSLEQVPEQPSKLGAQGFLKKPYRPQDMARLVRQALDERQAPGGRQLLEGDQALEERQAFEGRQAAEAPPDI